MNIVHFDLWLYIRSHSSSSMISVHLTVGLSEYNNFPKRKRQWTKHSKNKKCSFNLQLKCIFQKWKINYCFKLLNRAWPWRMSDLVFIFLNFPLEYFFLFWCLIDPRGSLANPMHSRVYWLSITNSKFDVSRHFWFRKYALRKLEKFFSKNSCSKSKMALSKKS